MTIFKSYDVRGVYPSELDEEIVEKIGKAYVSILGAKKIVVGRDSRTSSPALFDALVRGVVSMGCDVVDVGLCSTPMFYFAGPHLDADAGIMITASHNPAQYNGLKFIQKDAQPFGGEGIQEIKKLVEQNTFSDDGKGTVVEKDVFGDYMAKVLSFARFDKRLKVVVDIGNGMCGLTVPKILEHLPLDVVYLYDDVDLTFPNHEANPLKTETLRDLQKKVVDVGADIGIAFDGDGDRVGFVDENGNVVSMDLVGGLIGTDVLARNPGATILYDIRSSHAVPEIIVESGGDAQKVRVGHSFIKKMMRETGAAFACELSGHYYFEELHVTDSGIVAALHVLNVLAESGRSFSSVMESSHRYFHSGEFNFEVSDKDAMIKKVEETYGNGKKDYTDGITIEFDDWWVNVRKSNTEPLLRVNIEANTQDLLDEKMKEITQLLS